LVLHGTQCLEAEHEPPAKGSAAVAYPVLRDLVFQRRVGLSPT
jgi:hypothetical protein